MPANFLSIHNRLGTLLNVLFELIHLIITKTQPVDTNIIFILQRKELRIRQVGYFSKVPQLVSDRNRVKVQVFRLQGLTFHPSSSSQLYGLLCV